MRRFIFFLFLITFALPSLAQQLALPVKPDSLRFAVIGDTGTGERAQYEVADRLTEFRTRFPYEFVLMMGDNLYGREAPKDFVKKFERPYKALLDTGMKFYATLGNHDEPLQSHYKLFNMGGERYYTFKPKKDIRFFALDSLYMDKEQLQWLEKELRASGSDWKICFFHHPLYSSGEKHGSAIELREVLEPVLLKNGVDVVFAGHEHFYERIKPQKGIVYFISGAGAKLRHKNIRKTDFSAKGFDEDYHFMLVEMAGNQMYFQTISRTGRTIDSGLIARDEETDQKTIRAKK